MTSWGTKLSTLSAESAGTGSLQTRTKLKKNAFDTQKGLVKNVGKRSELYTVNFEFLMRIKKNSYVVKNVSGFIFTELINIIIVT